MLLFFNQELRTPCYRKKFYKVGDLLGIDYLEMHTIRKTSAYKQLNYNIDLAMHLLNYSSEAMTQQVY